MSGPDPVEGTEPVSPPEDPNNQQNPGTQPQGAPEVQSYKTVPNDMNKLRTEAPEVYDGVVKALANDILRQMGRSQRRIKQVMREGRQRY